MAFRPYLAFAGNCREAFNRYQQIFGGELVLLTMADVPADAGPPPQATIQQQATITTPVQARRDIALYNSRTGENRLPGPRQIPGT